MSDPRSPESVGLSVATAAASVGLTPATLRTWDRRYGLSPSIRTSGGHRRYDAEDLTRLRAAARLVEDGLPPAGAVRTVREMTLDQCHEQLATGGPIEVPHSAAAGQDQRAGGGRALALGNGTDEQRGIARAALALDGLTVRDTVSTAIDERGAIRAWNELALPLLTAVGERWARTNSGVEIEHVVSLAIAQAFEAAAKPFTSGRPVLLACAPQEQHTLALLALRAALGEHGVGTVMLGPRLPTAALVAATTRLRPRAIVLWSTTAANADPAILDALPVQRPPVKLFLAGPGWTQAGRAPRDPAASATTLSSLAEAVALLTRGSRVA